MVPPATPQAEQPHDSALEQCGAGAPLQRETDHDDSDGVVGRIAEKIQRIRAQAYRAGDKAGHNLAQKHCDIDTECRPQNPPIARVRVRPVAIVIAAGHA
jgi:hypothetical protein